MPWIGPALVALALLPASASAAATVEGHVLTYPVQFETFVPCANGGAGEIVAFSGSGHIVYHATVTPGGAETVREPVVAQGISGVGLTSGDRYVLTSAHISGFSSAYGGTPFESMTINRHHYVETGSGPVFTFSETLHVTRDATGELHVGQDDVTITCNGEEMPE